MIKGFGTKIVFKQSFITIFNLERVVKYCLFLLLLVGVNIFTQGQNDDSSSINHSKVYEGQIQNKEIFKYVIISSLSNTWGYDILKNDKLFIHQTTIPGLPGIEGFKKKKDAEKVAELVIEKLKRGEMPPSVTKDELKGLNILSTN